MIYYDEYPSSMANAQYCIVNINKLYYKYTNPFGQYKSVLSLSNI